MQTSTPTLIFVAYFRNRSSCIITIEG
uniref:Uncharacterized protein n=1 Tax=Arundo donax TaxID=35708 RepID=A0A0A9H151_ARUDO